jgi:cytoskeletal protein RodZ
MSLGKDLATIRKSQNLSLEDIQNAIKIPLDTIKSIESGTIFDDQTTNKTYVRSFVRSYAKVLKLDDDDVVQALDEMEAGTYSGSLVAGSDSPEDYTATSEIQFQEEDPADSDPAAFETGRSTSAPEPTKKSTQSKKPSSGPEINSINWADMGRKFTTAGKSSKVWIIISFLIVIGLIAGSAYIFWDDITSIFQQSSVTQQEASDPSLDQEAIIPAPLDSATVAEQGSQTDPDEENLISNEPITLGDTLTLSVYAAYGQLEPVRVTSDYNWRTNPFWMEEGQAHYFDFRDTLLIRGQYSRMLLLFNGHVIENPRQNYFDTAFNSIMITRSVLNQPEYLAPPPREFPLEIGPPDSTVYRIRY